MTLGEVYTKEQVEVYRRVFSTQEGREVLTDLMRTLGWGGSVTDDVDMASHNLATIIWAKLGVVHDMNYRGMVDALLTLPVPRETI